MIKQIYNIFKEEPIFQNGYLRFLYQDLKTKIDLGHFLFEDDTYLDYHIYKRQPIVRLNRIISKNKNKGNGTRIINQFLSTFLNKKVILKVDKNNIKAIRLYCKTGFKYEKDLPKGYAQYSIEPTN
jgi:RimJ/RimL family protein N-acetyltransferase|tara:strand:+ start:231 stop:608 length:378 start_codon:yes stop_codon:yes gene_type:complete